MLKKNLIKKGVKKIMSGSKKVKDELFPPVGKRIGDKAKVKPFVKGKLAPGTRSPASTSKLPPKIKTAKNVAKVAGIAAAGAAAATAIEGGGARMRRIRQGQK
tara:strand:+ start:31 stop:339 length:309 start_codon:yes stop_codon:yes gene_type:complete